MDKKNERITELRMKLNLTMEAFGERIGLSRQSISNIENGRRSVTNRMVMAVCREFGVSEAWLEDGTGEMFKSATSEEKLLDLAVQLGIGESFRKRLINALLRLSEDELARAEQFVNELAREQAEAGAAEARLSDSDEEEIRRKAEDYANQLRAEKIAEARSSASQGDYLSEAREA